MYATDTYATDMYAGRTKAEHTEEEKQQARGPEEEDEAGKILCIEIMIACL